MALLGLEAQLFEQLSNCSCLSTLLRFETARPVTDNKSKSHKQVQLVHVHHVLLICGELKIKWQ